MWTASGLLKNYWIMKGIFFEKQIPLVDFVFTPEYNRVFLSFVAKQLEPLEVVDIYENIHDEDINNFVNFLLH